MLEKEKNFHIWTAIVMFFALLIAGQITEAILMLIIGHLIEIKYELRKNKRKSID